MKILDRYIIKSLIGSYLICLLLVISFYIIIDLFSNFEKFGDYRTVLKKNQTDVKPPNLISMIARYYIYHIPLIFYSLAPVITLMACMFTMTRMARSNELIPLKAGGISMYRLLLPFIVFAFIIAIAMFFVHDYGVAPFSDELERLDHMKHSIKWRISMVQFRDSDGRIFYIGNYYLSKQTLEQIRVLIPISQQEFRLSTKIQANYGEWTKEQGRHAVRLKQGTITHYHPNGVIKTPAQPLPSEGYVIVTNLSDANISRPENKNLDMASISRLLEILGEYPKSLSSRLTLHLRFSQPIANLILVLLALPWLLGKETRNFFIGAGICAILSGAFYGLNIFCMNLGYKEFITPIFAAWFPSISFGSCSIWFWSAIHT